MMKDYKLSKDIIFWLTLLGAGFILSFTLWFDFGPDQAIFGYIALVWKKYHLLPYLGTFDADFPGIFIIHRLVLELFGTRIIGIRIFDFLGQMSSLIMIYYLAVRLSGRSAAGFLAGMFYTLYYFSLGPVHTAQRDDFVLWFLLASVLIALRWENRKWLSKALIGILLGFAFLIKPTYGLAWVIFGLWYLAREFRQRKKLIWAELLIFGFCCLLPGLMIFVFFYWRAQTLKELYYATLWYQFEIFAQIAPVSLAGRIRGAIFFIYTRLNQYPMILGGTIFWVLYWIRKRLELRRENEFALVALMILTALLSSWVQGKNTPYHSTPLWGFIMIFSGAGWAWIGSELEQNRSRLKATIFPWILYLCLVVLMAATLSTKQLKFIFLYPYRSLERAYRGQEHIFALDDQRAAAEYLRPLLKAEDQIEYFGWQPFLPYLLEKKAPTRFGVVYQLLIRNYDGRLRPKQAEWNQEFESDIISARPRFFIISTYIPSKDAIPLKDYSLKSHLEKDYSRLNDFIQQNYRLVTVIKTEEIYEWIPETERQP